LADLSPSAPKGIFMLRLFARSTAATLLILILTAGLAAAAPGPGEEGGPAPDWTLDALGGGTYSLADYRDKVVMMFVVGYG
jgi:hypothetical protein